MSLSQRQPWIADFRRECEAHGHVWSESQWSRPSGTTTGVFIGKPHASAARTILFLHGLGDDLLFPQVRLFRNLLSLGWSIATCDLDGHGMDNTSVFSSSDTRTAAQDLVSFVENLCPGRAKLHLVGFSLGGGLLLDFAIHNPERIESLTLIGTPLQPPTRMPLFSEIKGFFHQGVKDAAKEFGWYRTIPALGPFRRRHYPIRLSAGTTLSYFEEARRLLETLSVDASLLVTTFPTLYICGEYDFVAPMHLAKNLNLPTERLQLQTIEKASHFSSILSPICWKRLEIFLRTVLR